MARRALAGALRAAYVMASRFARSGLPCRPSIFEDRALIAVAGADAETFLQNIITTDLAVARRRRGAARRAAVAAGQDPVRFPGLARRQRAPAARLPRSARRRFRAPADALQAARQGDDRQAAIRRLSRSRGDESIFKRSTAHKLIQVRCATRRFPATANGRCATMRRRCLRRTRPKPTGMRCASPRRRRKRRRLCGGRRLPA